MHRARRRDRLLRNKRSVSKIDHPHINNGGDGRSRPSIITRRSHAQMVIFHSQALRHVFVGNRRRQFLVVLVLQIQFRKLQSAAVVGLGLWRALEVRSVVVRTAAVELRQRVLVAAAIRVHDPAVDRDGARSVDRGRGVEGFLRYRIEGVGFGTSGGSFSEAPVMEVLAHFVVR